MCRLSSRRTAAGRSDSANSRPTLAASRQAGQPPHGFHNCTLCVAAVQYGVPSELLVSDLFAPALPQLSCEKKQDAGRYDKERGQTASDHVHEERCGLVPARRLGWVRSVLGIRRRAMRHDCGSLPFWLSERKAMSFGHPGSCWDRTAAARRAQPAKPGLKEHVAPCKRGLEISAANGILPSVNGLGSRCYGCYGRENTEDDF